jgi:acyl-CoA thioesterase
MAEPNRLAFVELMALETLEPPNASNGVYEYMSKHPAYNPTGGAAFGGHVYSQSVWAAAQTVGKEGMVVHVCSLHEMLLAFPCWESLISSR